MVSFVQQTEGARPTGIGDQQIVKKDLSYIDSINSAIDSTFKAIDIAGDISSKATAKDLVTSAQAAVESERKESEEFAALDALGDDAGAKEVARKTALLEKGVAQGRITRENARLRVTDLVTKGIEESPIFASKIRNSASRLLGFDLQSEATKQFFGSFEPSGSAKKVNPREAQAQFMSDNLGLPITSTRQLVAQQEELSLRKSIRADKLELGDMTADQALAERSIEDSLEGVNNIFGEALALQREGGEINADTWAQLTSKHENAFVNATLEEYRASGLNITSEQEAKVRSNASARYKVLNEQISKFDSSFLNKQNLERLVTTQKLFGAQAMPVFSTLINSFGDRIGSQIIDMYANAAGKPERLQAALAANPALAPFVDLLSQDPEGFTKRMNSSLLKLNSPEVGDITAEDSGFIDLFLNQVGTTAPPKERESVIEKLANKGMPTKAASVLAKAGRTAATPKEVQFMKGEWAATKAGVPQQIAALIAELPNSTIELTAQGLVEKAGTRNVKGREIARAANSDVTAQLAKINTLLSAANKGWGKDFGISNLQSEATNMVNSINSLAGEIKEARSSEITSGVVSNGRVRAPSTSATETIFDTVIFTEKFKGVSVEDKQARLEELRAKQGVQ